jgi:tetratricopeptide (TPR) repeat protein
MIKKIILIILLWVLVTILFFGTSLWFDRDTGAVIWIVISLICLFLLLFSIIGLFKPKKYPLFMKTMSLPLVIFSILMLFSFTIALAFNTLIEERMGKGTDHSLIRIKEKIEIYKQLFAGHPIIENNQIEKFGNITFLYNKNEFSKSNIKIALETLKENEELYHQLFGNGKSEPVTIVLIEDLSTLQNENEAYDDGYISGYYVFEKKAIYVANPRNEKEINQFKRTIVHEYTHHLLSTAIENKGLNVSDFPLWFIEGLAAYVERMDVGTSEDEIKNIKNVDFNELKSNKQWNGYLRSPFDPYLQSRVLVGQLIKDEGASVIQKLIKNGRGVFFHKSFEKTTGKSLSSYESEIVKKCNALPSLILNYRRQFLKDNDPEAALHTAKKINDIVPNIYEVTNLIASIYLEKGNYEESIYYYKRNTVVFRNSVSYFQLAEALLFKDLDQAIEASEVSVKLADKDEIKFYQEYLDKLKKVKANIDYDHSFKGYAEFINGEEILSNNQKVNLLNGLLERYPEIKKGREDISKLKQSLER